MENTPQARVPLTEEQQKEKIIRSFIRDGKLSSIPVKAAKRDVILDYVAENLFESGRLYTESQVNGVLRPFYEDFCTLRRDLVDSGRLCREKDGSSYQRPVTSSSEV